jgi:hypothetical protein
VYADPFDRTYFAQDVTSPAFDAGVRLPNFNDDYAGKGPDIGAQEAGRPSLQFGPVPVERDEAPVSN